MTQTRSEPSGPARWTARQFHNQPAESHQHDFLVEMWTAVAEATDGKLRVSVHPQNDGVPGSDPQALEMLRSGDLQFMTLMGGILGRMVPVAEVQSLPFAFASHEQVHRVHEGPLGALIGEECRAKGIHRFRFGLLENGFRHIAMRDRPIRSADDLDGVRMRVPDGEMFRDLFLALGATPATVNINQIYDALGSGRVDGQENPLVVTEYNRLYEVTRYMSLTSHMWSGFNLLANGRFWDSLPEDIQSVVDRHVKTHVARQRKFTDDANRALETKLVERGMVFNTADTESFRQRLAGGFYARWKERLGTRMWGLLEAETGVRF
jgi:tripartite ATP-independent transporter DctP family solute receptor